MDARLHVEAGRGDALRGRTAVFSSSLSRSSVLCGQHVEDRDGRGRHHGRQRVGEQVGPAPLPQQRRRSPSCPETQPPVAPPSALPKVVVIDVHPARDAEVLGRARGPSAR